MITLAMLIVEAVPLSIGVYLLFTPRRRPSDPGVAGSGEHGGVAEEAQDWLNKLWTRPPDAREPKAGGCP